MHSYASLLTDKPCWEFSGYRSIHKNRCQIFSIFNLSNLCFSQHWHLLVDMLIISSSVSWVMVVIPPKSQIRYFPTKFSPCQSNRKGYASMRLQWQLLNNLQKALSTSTEKPHTQWMWTKLKIGKSRCASVKWSISGLFLICLLLNTSKTTPVNRGIFIMW